MGSWDTTAFANDTAADWLAELVESNGWEMIDEAFSSILAAGDDFIEAQQGEEGIAAAEVVAWINGQPGSTAEDTDALEQWIDEQEFESDTSRAKRARKVVDRIFNEPSELRDQWEDEGEFEEWRKELTSLKDRLAGS
ncbi:DUF4259 domain-containing protein [Haloferula sargassicola]|uniref:DUF4259 domain-containing protein n=1 Tax=Haloferula sargassicola TaxID=490096 RepID=A0ABP9UVF7_9BACT